MTQTSVPYSIAAAIAGAKADLTHGVTQSYVNAEASAEMPFGIVVKEGANDGEALLLTASSNKLAGLVLHSHAYDVRYELGTTGIKPKVMLNIMRKGRAWVQVEEPVNRGDIPWVRVATGALGTVVGSFRKSQDGGQAEVHTITPTAVDTTVYAFTVLLLGVTYTFTFTSGSGTSATAIVTGLKAACAANAAFTALVTASGSATLILTAIGAAIGASLTVTNTGAGTLTDALTTPGASEKHTITPTAANATIYVMRVEIPGLGKTFDVEFLSDGSATATKVVTGLTAALTALGTEFSALITASGTATLILTTAGAAVGFPIIVQSIGDGVLADVITVAEAGTAVKLLGCEYLTTQAAAGGLAQVEVDFNAYRAFQG